MNHNDPLAFLLLVEGPKDGLEIQWPKNGGNFPSFITFGYFTEENVVGDAVGKTRKIRVHKYESFDSWSAGKLLDDGLPQEEYQSYMYTGSHEEEFRSLCE